MPTTDKEEQDDTRMNSIWHRIAIDSPELTRGEKLKDFLLDNLPGKALGTAVIVAGVEGGGDPELGITQLGCVMMTNKELQGRLGSTSQIDWANFYFLAIPDEGLKCRVCGGLSISDAISESSLSIRVIDDSSLEVFTPDHSLIADLKSRYPFAHVESSLLSEMDFPQ
jgi:hypothetical protein